ncbi:hypothetical protein [Nonomuraea endophytica]|uniref:hypothetical protein n=1 Tax=Nonomuraea endophytica TaxID=714136 RepID=UPI0037CC1EB0
MGAQRGAGGGSGLGVELAAAVCAAVVVLAVVVVVGVLGDGVRIVRAGGAVDVVGQTVGEQLLGGRVPRRRWAGSGWAWRGRARRPGRPG